MSEARMSYDPIGDLAALVDGLHGISAGDRMEDVLGRLLAGPYARLRGGLLLDEPGREAITTPDAIREALQVCITKTGHLITAAEIEGWVAGAERGYDLPPRVSSARWGRLAARQESPEQMAPPPHSELGPGSGHQADGPADCRRCQMIRENADWLALPEPDPQGPRWEDHEDF